MVLRTAAMVVGIIAGTNGLIVGLFGLLVGLSGAYIVSGIALLFVITPSIVGVVGAGIVRSKPLKGSGLMAAASIVLISAMFAFIHSGGNTRQYFPFPLEFFLFSPAALFYVGAILAVIGKFLS
jgi:hypothetical protein